MNEGARGHDAATVTIVQEAFPELEVNPPTEETASEAAVQDAPIAVDYEQLAMQVVLTMQRIVESGDQIAAVAVNPQYLEGFREAFLALPGEAVHRDPATAAMIKEKLPIHPDPEISLLQVITGTDLERDFLQSYFGPQGNGLLPRMEQVLSSQPFPVRITIDWLRGRYLDEVAERVAPKIITPDSRAGMNTRLLTARR